jgi:hypothetical protein
MDDYSSHECNIPSSWDAVDGQAILHQLVTIGNYEAL